MSIDVDIDDDDEFVLVSADDDDADDKADEDSLAVSSCDDNGDVDDSELSVSNDDAVAVIVAGIVDTAVAGAVDDASDGSVDDASDGSVDDFAWIDTVGVDVSDSTAAAVVELQLLQMSEAGFSNETFNRVLLQSNGGDVAKALDECRLFFRVEE
jgi:hypothetical protein